MRGTAAPRGRAPVGAVVAVPSVSNLISYLLNLNSMLSHIKVTLSCNYVYFLGLSKIYIGIEARVRKTT